MALQVAKDGETLLMMTNAKGKERARFAASGQGPGITLWDESDRTRAAMRFDRASSELVLGGPDKSSVVVEGVLDAHMDAAAGNRLNG
jgi:hypothetical protein